LITRIRGLGGRLGHVLRAFYQRKMTTIRLAHSIAAK